MTLHLLEVQYLYYWYVADERREQEMLKAADESSALRVCVKCP